MHRIKCIVVGDSKVGKTTLLNANRNKTFQDYIPNMMDDYSFRTAVDGTSVFFSPWDNRGRDQIESHYIAHTDVILICFSLVDRQSFNNVKEKWYPEIASQCLNVPILVGTKLDLVHDVSCHCYLFCWCLVTTSCSVFKKL